MARGAPAERPPPVATPGEEVRARQPHRPPEKAAGPCAAPPPPSPPPSTRFPEPARSLRGAPLLHGVFAGRAFWRVALRDLRSQRDHRRNPEKQDLLRPRPELLQVPVAADVLRHRADRRPGHYAHDLQPARTDQ